MKKLLYCLMALLLAFSMFLISCNDDEGDDGNNQPTIKGPFEFYSSAFDSGQAIPKKYTCTGDDVSPPLAWKNVPTGTKSLALVMFDPDANNFVHWVVFNIPASTTSLAEGATNLPGTCKQANNGWGNASYGGPCPPSGTHRYFFNFYALDKTLDFNNGANPHTILSEINDATIEKKVLVGKYQK